LLFHLPGGLPSNVARGAGTGLLQLPVMGQKCGMWRAWQHE
jgi:hypothetical protein